MIRCNFSYLADELSAYSFLLLLFWTYARFLFFFRVVAFLRWFVLKVVSWWRKRNLLYVNNVIALNAKFYYARSWSKIRTKIYVCMYAGNAASATKTKSKSFENCKWAWFWGRAATHFASTADSRVKMKRFFFICNY